MQSLQCSKHTFDATQIKDTKDIESPPPPPPGHFLPRKVCLADRSMLNNVWEC